MKNLTFLLLTLFCLSLGAQEEESIYDGLFIEQDSIKTPYKPASKNYAFIKSKTGAGGVEKTSKGDSILALPVTEIVLVFTEDNPDDINKRDRLNRKRWENLNKTYPEFISASSNFKSICQCNTNGDTAAFKKMQGFYVYFPGKEPAKAEPKVEAKKEEKVTTESSKKSKKEEPVEEKKEEKVKKEKRSKEEPKEEVAKEEKPKKEKRAKEEKAEPVAKMEEPAPVAEPEVKVKKEGYTKPKRSKNAAACRLPCYENGEEDLHAFFRDNIKLSKKQKRRSDDLVTVLRLQLNFDGSIKKVLLQGANQDFNKQVEEAVKNMNLWNPAVKGGVTMKSEVKMTLKYDPETKAIKPFETMITPRLGPKCKCASDSELGLE